MTMVDFDLPDTMALRPSRRPPVGNSEFRTAMTGMGSTVCVVAARRGEELVGRTVTAVLSLSTSPPAVLVSIDIVSRLADLISKTGGFSLAVLADDQAEIADAFAGKVDAQERFSLGRWEHWPSGQPHLHGTVSMFDCEVIGAMETGTHVLFAGAVVEVETATDRAPLIWHRRDYHTLASLDQE